MNLPDYSKVGYPSIQKLFKDAAIEGPAQLKPVCFNGKEEEYLKHEAIYTVNAPLAEVWTGYKNLHPALAWNSKMIRLGFMYSRLYDTYIYTSKDEYPGIAKGQIYLVNLNIAQGLKIAVAHEVDEVDDKEHIIKLCYLNTGKTEGSQWIRMSENGKNQTHIEHKTLYKGSSYVRDRILYPYFHKKAMNQFHQKMKDLITNNSK
ncbi:MAG: hypothetical protein ACFHWX_02840 [Bacteroidota bacterium]